MNRKRIIPIGSFGRSLHKLFSGKKTLEDESYMGKIYGEPEDNFFEALNAKLIAALNLNKQSKESYEKDLKRFGTHIGLIDVADDAIPNRKNRELPSLKKPLGKRRFRDTWEEDLKRYGTRHGLIEVANDRKKKIKQKPLPFDFSKVAFRMMMDKWKIRETTPFSVNPFSDIYREFPKVQVTVHNKSADEKEVVLWGSNQNISVSQPSPEDVQDHTITTQISVPGGIHPQGIVFNPANMLVYVANQLSGTITVVDSNNQVVKLIQLEPSFPGFSSPVALAVNSKSTSSKYGYVYVVCSVSNTLAVIDLALNVTDYIPVDIRPVAVAFNPVSMCVYVTNLVSNTISVIHAETLAEVPGSPFPTGQDPIGVGINPLNGDIYIANSLENSVTVYDGSHTLITTIAAVGSRPVSVTFNPANGFMYAVSTDSNNIYQINASTYFISATIPVGNKPYNSFFDSANGFLYVQNRVDNTLTIIKPDNSIAATLNLGEQNIGGAYNSENNSIYISDTGNNTINVVGYLSLSSAVSVNPEYAEANEDFQGNPGIIQHTKFVVTGQERLHSFRLSRFTPTGMVRSKPISFELYASPQSKLNVAEVTELAGTIIDGKMNWRFRLPGLHSVSVLVWFRQFEVRDLLNPK